MTALNFFRRSELIVPTVDIFDRYIYTYSFFFLEKLFRLGACEGHSVDFLQEIPRCPYFRCSYFRIDTCSTPPPPGLALSPLPPSPPLVPWFCRFFTLFPVFLPPLVLTIIKVWQGGNIFQSGRRLAQK
jgi:hypothetical protein